MPSRSSGRKSALISAVARAGFSLFIWLAFFCLCASTRAAEIIVPEPQAKAAFLFSFPKYVEWPATSFEAAASPIRICIMGDDAIATELTKLAQGKLIGGRKVQVDQPGSGELKNCHLVFISSSQKNLSAQLLRSLQDNAALTVADFESFLDAGGMINLATRGTRIRFSVNLAPAERAKLKLNSKLLALAERVVK